MKRLSEQECLLLWERGRTLHPIDQGVLALDATAAAGVEGSAADWPLGRRSRALAELYCASFGTHVRGWTSCAACAEMMEFDIDGEAIAATGAAESDAQVSTAHGVFRLPTSRDLALAAACGDADEAAALLLERCALAEGGGVNVVALAEREREEIEAKMAEADPLAEITLEFECTACGFHFGQVLELAQFVWAELESKARRLLWDVHLLAAAYGWSEGDILAMPASRRGLYVEMVRP